MKRTSTRPSRPRALSEPVTITMLPVFHKKAKAIMDHTGEKISELIRRLIREEWERLNSPSPKQPAPSQPIVPFEDKGSQRVPKKKN